MRHIQSFIELRVEKLYFGSHSVLHSELGQGHFQKTFCPRLLIIS